MKISPAGIGSFNADSQTEVMKLIDGLTLLRTLLMQQAEEIKKKESGSEREREREREALLRGRNRPSLY
jgi:hypothetical protein